MHHFTKRILIFFHLGFFSYPGSRPASSAHGSSYSDFPLPIPQTPHPRGEGISGRHTPQTDRQTDIRDTTRTARHDILPVVSCFNIVAGSPKTTNRQLSSKYEIVQKV